MTRRSLWTAANLAKATGGRASRAFQAHGVSIDTRSLEPGDLFIALDGARDGHEFVAQAMASGAAGVLASRPVDAPHVLVPDTFLALQALGIAARERAAQARRAAITGSVGKTSVTQAVAAGLARAGRAHTSVKSYNNHIGVPLTLARMPADTERAVFEIGMNHADEITPLSGMVRPHVVAITTVGPVHVENFPDGETGVARAKAEIFDGTAQGAVAVLNADNRWFGCLSARARARGLVVRSFGRAEGADARLTDFGVEAGRGVIRGEVDGRPVDLTLSQTGAHWGLNAMAVLLLLEAMDVSQQDGLAALSDFQALPGRGAESLVRSHMGDFTLIDESYNANPISMAATIGSLGVRRAPGRRILALTDMLELGDEATRFHADLARPIADAGIDLVFCAGPLMKSLWDALPSTRRGGYAVEASELAPMISATVGQGDLVMVKGSNGSRAGLVAGALRALDRSAGGAG
ncbi:UDP-N-acetylmuramoyl-tripeptide--D-alanyl-D-alanine ligase [Phenylobacterium sp.]|jgi:UDP-N-acetylmuramoyl-tripeptide--D-alanyl-D-alanine ligase|uniref:UDP-N-acetylmuramoyl-tripeptide--D-alanyl-D- alanine ligase n=1 Tax=Phenylobacterium sp. TaxID=1871053 RepID=UPI0037C77F11